MFQLLTRPDSQPKLIKGQKRGIMSFALHLAPADLSGHEVCPMRTAGCSAACLNTAGHGGIIKIGQTSNPIQDKRIWRTKWFFADRAGFMHALVDDIERAVAYAHKKGFDAAFRLNATSDIPWHRIPAGAAASIMARFPTVQFYDYTKVAKRLLREHLPGNYHLTFSSSGENDAECKAVLAMGGNVAVVYRTRAMCELAIAAGIAIDGDETDLRFLDEPGRVVALYAKGKARRDDSGFVVDYPIAA